MVLDFVPRKQLQDWLTAGWRLLPSHEYQPGDYAILIMLPDSGEDAEPMTDAQIRSACASLYRRPPKPRGMSIRNLQRIRARIKLETA